MPKEILFSIVGTYVHSDEIIYKEHNDAYLNECLLNLKSKNAELINGKNIEQMLIEIELND